MGKLYTKVSDYEYHEYDWRLTEQSILRLDDEVIIEEILRELTTLKDINDTTTD